MTKSQNKKISNDLEDLLEDVVHALKKSRDEVTEEAQEALGTAAVKLAKTAQTIVAETKERSVGLATAAAAEARAHPIATAAAMAMAAAAVAGLLMTHNKSAGA